MNKLPLIWIIIFFCTLPLFAQSVDAAWVRRYNGPGNYWDWPSNMVVDSKGNVYVTGYSFGHGTGRDYVTIKYYPNGDTAWVRRYSGAGTEPDDAWAVTVDSSGNVYVTGRSFGVGTQLDFATIKYYANGDTAWVRKYNGPMNDWDGATSIAVDVSDNVYVTGESRGVSTGYDYVTIKYFPNGDTAWVRRYDYSYDLPNAIAVDQLGNVFVTGQSGKDFATIKYFPNGDTAWIRRYNSGGFWGDNALAIVVDNQGSIYVTGYGDRNDAVNDYVTIKYYSNGDTAWVRRHSNGVARALILSNLGDVCVTGTNGTVKYSADGRLLWTGSWGGVGLAVDSFNNIYVTGKGKGDYATIKYDQYGNLIWVARYNGPANGEDEATAVAVDVSGNVYVIGWSEGIGTKRDYTTIKYVQKSEDETKDWKIYQFNKPGFEIRYPADIIKVSKEGEKLFLTHSIPFEHENPCDLIGDAPPLTELIDFRVSIQVFNKSFKETIETNEYPDFAAGYLVEDSLKVDHGFIDDVRIGSLRGYRITAGAEGCGIYTYYFPLDSNNTLKVQRSFIPELQPVITDYKDYLKLPGIIPPDEEEKLFNLTLSSFKLLK